MLFAYLLASALALSVVLGRSADPASVQMTYVKEDQTIMQSDKMAQVTAVDDRSSNLKFVMAIQSSSIWEEIKKRSLLISTPQGLDDTVAEKSLENLTDQELAQLKQACHDGLKCVAVDQLLVLKQVKEPLADGKVSVRTAITKITQVLSQYTTEYHEDIYQYEAVTQSDDESKVYESVTTIVEDNKELCKVDLTPVTVKSYPKNGDSNTVPAALNKNGTVNYNTVENYNINNGTINSATINIKPHSGDTVDDDQSKHKTPLIDTNEHTATTDGSQEHHDVNADHRSTASTTVNSTPAITDGLIPNKSVTEAPKNNPQHEHARPNHIHDSETSDRHYIHVPTTYDYPERTRSTDDHRKHVGQQLMITDGPSARDGVVSGKGSAADIDTHNNGHGQKSQQSRPGVTGHTNSAKGSDANNKVVLNRSNGNGAFDHTVTKNTADGIINNTVELDGSSNGKAGGEIDSDSDIVSAGSNNELSSKKGLVEDGFLNNGIMKVTSSDKSNRNKGTIKGAKAKNGIINIGTTNNGQVNYGTVNDSTNNGTMMDEDNYNLRQYVNDIDEMYSKILNEFAKE